MTNTQTMEGKVYTITGAAGGIGLDTALRLAAQGATLSLADINTEQLQNALDSIAGSYPGCKVITETVDVRKRDQVDTWIAKTLENFGRIDGCINSAGKQSCSIIKRQLSRIVEITIN